MLKTDILWAVFEKIVSKPVIEEEKNAFELLKKAKVAKMLPKQINKPSKTMIDISLEKKE